MGIFDKFKKPAGLDEKLECGFCHKKMYTLSSSLSIDEKLQIIDKGYQWCTVYRCSVCGGPVCDSCMRTYFRTNCEHKSGNVVAMPAAYK